MTAGGERESGWCAGVLVVDDDRWTTRAVAAAIDSASELHVVAQVHNGEDAVEAYAKHQPDVVLMDVNMAPGMSGVDATVRILQLDPAARIVILTTVSPGPGIARALESGALAAVQKDAPEKVLVEVARSAALGEPMVRLGELARDIALSGMPVPDAHARAPRLTDRERQTLQLICEGLDYEDISARLSLEVSTVKSHARSLRDKFDARSQAQILVQAMKFKFYAPP